MNDYQARQLDLEERTRALEERYRLTETAKPPTRRVVRRKGYRASVISLDEFRARKAAQASAPGGPS